MSDTPKDTDKKETATVERIWEHRDARIHADGNTAEVTVEQAKKEAIEAIKDSKYFLVMAMTNKSLKQLENDPRKIPGMYRGLHVGFYAPLFCDYMHSTIREIMDCVMRGGGQIK